MGEIITKRQLNRVEYEKKLRNMYEDVTIRSMGWIMLSTKYGYKTVESVKAVYYGRVLLFIKNE